MSPIDPDSSPRSPRSQRLAIHVDEMRERIGVFETTLYLIVGAFLIVAGVLLLFDTA